MSETKTITTTPQNTLLDEPTYIFETKYSLNGFQTTAQFKALNFCYNKAKLNDGSIDLRLAKNCLAKRHQSQNFI